MLSTASSVWTGSRQNDIGKCCWRQPSIGTQSLGETNQAKRIHLIFDIACEKPAARTSHLEVGARKIQALRGRVNGEPNCCLKTRHAVITAQPRSFAGAVPSAHNNRGLHLTLHFEIQCDGHPRAKIPRPLIRHSPETIWRRTEGIPQLTICRAAHST